MKLLYTIANALQRRSKIPVSDRGDAVRSAILKGFKFK